MSRLLEKATEIILDAIRHRDPNADIVTIPIENIPQNVDYFNRALVSHRVRQAAARASVTVELKLIVPHVEQAKKQIIDYCRNRRDAHIVFPTYEVDAADLRTALESPEVQQVLAERNLTGEVRVVDNNSPQIVIATYEDAVNQ